jgi:Fic family protein
VPDFLTSRSFSLAGPVAADVADAELAIAELDRTAPALASTEALARILLRAESVASSRIEGLQVGPRRLLQAAAALEEGRDPGDVSAAEVLGNIEAMDYALGAVGTGSAITLPLLLEAHARLLKRSRLAEHGGVLRTQQNWIGGSNYTPVGAAFVPPPPELVPDLMEDLCAFCSHDDLPAVAQAAIAHAQFETIHPFVDGNGRVGRALIQMIFRRRGLAQNVVPPVSLILATRTNDYLHGLSAMRYVGDVDSPDAQRGLDLWLGTFAAACTRAVADAAAFQQSVTEIQAGWRTRLGAVRADSAALRLVDVLPGTPVLSAATASHLIDRSLQSTLDGISRLVDAGILAPTREHRQRGQVYEARDIILRFSALERQLASPTGDTQIDPPTRPVPARMKLGL